jgi:Porin PorA
MKKQVIAIVGVILLIAGIGWRFVLGTQLNQRFPDGWKWEMNTLGKNSFADATTGQFPAGTTLADDPDSLNTRTISATTENAPAGHVIITDYYAVHNATTNALDWDFSTNATVDATTGKYTEGPYQGEYYLIPHHPEKTTYVVSNSSYEHIQMAFQREEVVSGMNTYLFAYYGELPNTQSYPPPDYTFEPGQQVICFDYTVEYWVEPTTGEIVKYNEVCQGDWVVDANGQKLYGLQRWGSTSQVDDIVRRVDIVQTELNNYRMNSVYIPMVLIVLGVLALGFAFLPGLLKDGKDNKEGEAAA